MKYNVFVIVFLLISFLKLFRSSIIFSDGTDVKNSMVEIHGLETSVPKYIICIGVGTCLSVKNYRRLAERIVNVVPDALTVILDPNPSGRGFFHRIVHPGIIKFRASDFASAFCKASTWIHSSIYSRRKVFEWYVGGHSSSGQGAYAAVTRQYLTEKISGYIGLDPCCIYNIVNEPLLVPSIVWTTSDPFANCVPSIIAGAGFHNRIISSAIGKLHISHSLFRLTDKSKHCIFSDDGCPVFGCTGTGNNVAEAHTKVARSIRDFITGRKFKAEDYPQVSITTNTAQ